MLINEVCKRCGLTKKAIEYYEEQGLTRPQIMGNGYRVFSEDDVIRLNKIAASRGLGISVSDIKTVLAEKNHLSFQTICDKKELEISDIQAKQQLLHMLARNQNWEDARAQLRQLDAKQSILSRLLDRFPGYFGEFISLHFAPYLNERIVTDEQQDAFETIIDFLDGVNIVRVRNFEVPGPPSRCPLFRRHRWKNRKADGFAKQPKGPLQSRQHRRKQTESCVPVLQEYK